MSVTTGMNFGRAGIPIVQGIASLSAQRKVWFCDVWGVLHDGAVAFPSALDACRAFRREGGEVALISNSPRPSADVLTHLSSLGVRQDCFDTLVTSGDVTRTFVAAYGTRPVFHIGPERDKAFFDGLEVRFAPATAAAVCVCTGFFDEDREVPEDYDELLAQFAARSVPMICANPDLYVERGNRLLPCAGLIAGRYAALGQTVIQAGKPHAPIYEAAFAKLKARPEKTDILAIGDGADTDIEGAAAQGIDSIYIASRVFMTGADSRVLDPGHLEALFSARSFRPLAAMAHLAW